VSRFDQEAELLQQLQHPNIVALHEHFIAYRTRFIVLDLYDGADLRKVVRHHGPIRESVVRGVLGQIAAGLRYAHQHGVLHLDLKPANVLIDKQGHVAITDFGLSRLIESDGCDQECVGTPVYMPPEQFMMTNVGPHSDWYSFGCIAYEMMSGKRLFQDDESSHFLHDKLRLPSSTWPEVDASESLCRDLRTALHPMVEHRGLDLDRIATWAKPVPELAIVPEESHGST
jgi:serine/threonine protein kinase